MKKAQDQRATVVLITPHWAAQPWFSYNVDIILASLIHDTFPQLDNLLEATANVDPQSMLNNILAFLVAQFHAGHGYHSPNVYSSGGSRGSMNPPPPASLSQKYIYYYIIACSKQSTLSASLVLIPCPPFHVRKVTWGRH